MQLETGGTEENNTDEHGIICLEGKDLTGDSKSFDRKAAVVALK